VTDLNVPFIEFVKTFQLTKSGRISKKKTTKGLEKIIAVIKPNFPSHKSFEKHAEYCLYSLLKFKTFGGGSGHGRSEPAYVEAVYDGLENNVLSDLKDDVKRKVIISAWKAFTRRSGVQPEYLQNHVRAAQYGDAWERSQNENLGNRAQGSQDPNNPRYAADNDDEVQAELDDMTVFGNGGGIADDNEPSLALDANTDWHKLAYEYANVDGGNPLDSERVAGVWNAMPDVDGAMPRVVLPEQLGNEQKHAFDMIMKLANALSPVKDGARRMIVTGGAGAGKSYFVDAVRHALGADRVLIYAYSAKAAANVMGRTIHGHFHILPNFFKELGNEKLEEFQEAMENKLILIDEYTMVDGDLLRMRAATRIQAWLAPVILHNRICCSMTMVQLKFL
jgi:hypothetical protein